MFLPVGRGLIFGLVLIVGVSCVAEICADGVDNDGDALVDCADPACILFPGCTACGDGVLDDAESCDDGNREDNDRCSNRCEKRDCGNGELDEGEECDDGNVARGDRCSDRCEVDQCGDGRADFGEECDDGNSGVGDGCSNRCHIERGVLCGNSHLDPGEECDDGNRDSNDSCGPLCRVEFCGDGVRQTGEPCDGDDGIVDGERCLDCQIDRCGNGRVDGREECDGDGELAAGVRCVACRIERCGNGRREGNEECDDGNAFVEDGCSACRSEFCGDGIRQAGLRESCDGVDGLDDGDRCIGCQIDRCGNGRIDALEECDDGNLIDFDSCTRCAAARCGNGQREAAETCDHGPLGDDTCGSDCRGRLFVGGLVWVVKPHDVNELTPPFRGITEADDQGLFFVSGRSSLYAFSSRGEALLEGPRGPGPILNEPVRSNVDGTGPVEVIGCNRLLYIDPIDGRSRTEINVACTLAVTAVDDDGAREIYALGFTGLNRISPPFDSPQIDAFTVSASPGPHGLVSLRGPQKRIALIDDDDEVLALDAATGVLTELGYQADLVFGADLDGDGSDELLVSAGSTVSVIELGVAHDLEFVVKRFTRGDVDGDGIDDVVVLGEELACFWLSTDGTPSAAFAVPSDPVAVVVDGALLVFGGPEFQPAVGLRLNLNR